MSLARHDWKRYFLIMTPRNIMCDQISNEKTQESKLRSAILAKQWDVSDTHWHPRRHGGVHHSRSDKFFFLGINRCTTATFVERVVCRESTPTITPDPHQDLVFCPERAAVDIYHGEEMIWRTVVAPSQKSYRGAPRGQSGEGRPRGVGSSRVRYTTRRRIRLQLQM